MVIIAKIVSGGQTGADRAALNWAINQDIPHGGWCPKGRKALDGPLDARYLLKETPSANYLQRNEWNVRDSDGTVVFTLADEVTGGSKKTISFAMKLNKPWLHLHPGLTTPAELLASFIREHQIHILNVAGSREAKEPGIYDWVKGVFLILRDEARD